MIHAHIRKMALSVNEESYQCVLPDNCGEANAAFEDTFGMEPKWLSAIRHQQFAQKLRTASVDVGCETRVLDACCGQGSLGEYLLHRGASVTFCDLSSRQLAALKIKLGQNSLRATAVEADVHTLPFRDGEFDLVVGNSFLHHLSDVPRALRELNRVVRPGGKLVFLHEPSAMANYWETFPLSLVRNTTYNSNFTDLWQFEVERIAEVFKRAEFLNVSIYGSGVMSAVLINWYLILLGKCGITTRVALEPALRFRELCYLLERSFCGWMNQKWFPSLLIVGQR